MLDFQGSKILITYCSLLVGFLVIWLAPLFPSRYSVLGCVGHGRGFIGESCSWEGKKCVEWKVLWRSVSDKEVVYVKGCLGSKGREALRAGPLFTRGYWGYVSLGCNLSMICGVTLNEDIAWFHWQLKCPGLLLMSVVNIAPASCCCQALCCSENQWNDDTIRRVKAEQLSECLRLKTLPLA